MINKQLYEVCKDSSKYIQKIWLQKLNNYLDNEKKIIYLQCMLKESNTIFKRLFDKKFANIK